MLAPHWSAAQAYRPGSCELLDRILHLNLETETVGVAVLGDDMLEPDDAGRLARPGGSRGTGRRAIRLRRPGRSAR